MATPDHPGPSLFEAVLEGDYDSLVKLYASNARNSVMSYLSMKSRWAQQQENYTQSGKHETNKKHVLCSLVGLCLKAGSCFGKVDFFYSVEC
jgi:hypothetical protein